MCMRSSRISEACACATVSQKSAHAQQKDLRSLCMRSSRISEVCACATVTQKSAHTKQPKSLVAVQAHRQMPTACACVLRFIIHPVTNVLTLFVQQVGKLRGHIYWQGFNTILNYFPMLHKVKLCFLSIQPCEMYSML